jgi:NAD-dependent SIR2 family protein deacetylase
MNTKWECKDCNWKGYENELDYEQVEGCVGDDKLEICPKCGSQKVFMI